MKTKIQVATLRLPTKLWSTIQTLAEQENLSAQQWAQRALTQAVEQQTKKGGKP